MRVTQQQLLSAAMVVLAVALVPAARAAETGHPHACVDGIAPETAKRIFDAMKESPPAPDTRTIFDGVSTDGPALRIKWVRDGKPCPPLRVIPQSCSGVPEIESGALNLEIPPEFPELCPGLSTQVARLRSLLPHEPSANSQPQPQAGRWAVTLLVAVLAACLLGLWTARQRLFAAGARVASASWAEWKKTRAGITSLSPSTIGVFLAAAGLLWNWGVDPNISWDVSLQLIHARVCRAGSVPCSSLLVGADGTSLTHGSLWTRVLMLADSIGVSPSALAVAMTLAIALAAAVVFRWVEGVFHPVFAPLAYLWFLTCVTRHLPNIWNPTFALLPVAAFYYGISVAVVRGRPAWLLFCSAMAYWATQGHVTCFVLLPVLVAAAVISVRSVPVALALALGPFSVLWPALSWDSARINLDPKSGLVFPLAGAIVAATVIAILLRKRAARNPVLILAIAVLCLAGTFSLAAQALRFWAHLGEKSYYDLSIWPAIAASPACVWVLVRAAVVPLGVVAAPHGQVPTDGGSRMRWALAGTLPWVVAVALVYGLPHGWHRQDLADWLTQREYTDGPRISEARVISNELNREALPISSLRSRDARQMRAAVAALGEARTKLAAKSDEQLRVLAVRQERVPKGGIPGWRMAALSGGRVMLASRFAAWVQVAPENLICWGRQGNPLDLDAAELSSPHRNENCDPPAAKDSTSHNGRFSVQLAVAPSAGAVAHVFQLVDDQVSWTIDSATAGETSGGRGREQVTLAADDWRRGGDIRISTKVPLGGPAIIESFETLEGESDIRDLLNVNASRDRN